MAYLSVHGVSSQILNTTMGRMRDLLVKNNGRRAKMPEESAKGFGNVHQNRLRGVHGGKAGSVVCYE